jgi:hypothetical protein
MMTICSRLEQVSSICWAFISSFIGSIELTHTHLLTLPVADDDAALPQADDDLFSMFASTDYLTAENTAGVEDTQR